MKTNSRFLEPALEVFGTWQFSPRSARRQLLQAWISTLKAAAEEIARAITRETGKPITLARGELLRSQDTLQATSEALASFGEEAIPYDLMAGADGCRATFRRYPRGVIMAITPFNFPVNLAMHKLAPAVGAGCAVIWKPCPQAPETSALLLASFHAGCELVQAPGKLIQLASLSPQEAEAMARDDRVALVSFTGSEGVGMRLKSVLNGKPLTLELGGNAAVVLDEGIDAAKAAGQLAHAAMAAGGQSCCKAQRFYVHNTLMDSFVTAFVDAVRALPCGDPLDESTVIGPLISEDAALKADSAVDAAVAAGARVLLRGTRQGRLLPPIVLCDQDDRTLLCCEEAFAPIAIIVEVASFEEGLQRAADTRFGLRSSIYSRDQRNLRLAERKLRAGSILLNLPPTFRLDSAPFGGLLASGQGYEGPRWAMESFTEGRLIVEGLAP